MNEASIQESTPQPISDQTQGNVPKLWNPEAAGGWSLIFNPVFGSILVLMNWQALGEREKIRSAQIAPRRGSRHLRRGVFNRRDRPIDVALDQVTDAEIGEGLRCWGLDCTLFE